MTKDNSESKEDEDKKGKFEEVANAVAKKIAIRKDKNRKKTALDIEYDVKEKKLDRDEFLNELDGIQIEIDNLVEKYQNMSKFKKLVKIYGKKTF